MRALLSRKPVCLHTHIAVSVKAGLREPLSPNECLHKDPRLRRAVIKGPRGAFFRSVRLTKGYRSICPAVVVKLGLNCPRIIVLSGSRVCENTVMRCVEVWR